jgi:hypothetical protein
MCADRRCAELVRKHPFMEEFHIVVEVEDHLPRQTEGVPSLSNSDADDDITAVQRTISELWKEADGVDVSGDGKCHLVRMKMKQNSVTAGSEGEAVLPAAPDSRSRPPTPPKGSTPPPPPPHHTCTCSCSIELACDSKPVPFLMYCNLYNDP